ncbi:MAG: class I SAM-dependent methyltransferase [Alphaproteobacteria bacterium]|nr:class I SAM-dependent methyltransferase [Alphaproteobacteria bacterium]
MQLGDFSALAKNYINRPAYDTELIKKIMEHMGTVISDIAIADVGAGTGKLTKVLAAMGAHNISAVEPNDEMRKEGEFYTKEFAQIRWSKGTGEETGLPDNCADWVTMASSFHWTDPNKSLPEFSRILKNVGYFSIMWNTRDIASSELHTEIENIIYEIAPNIKRVSSGNASHTKNWEEVLVSTGHFKNVKFIETSYMEHMTKERYMGAWRSVNDIRAQAGEENFNLILEKIEQKLNGMNSIDVPYKMRSWTVQKC